ncbi:unnamed protein product [Prunus armeniaca]
MIGGLEGWQDQACTCWARSRGMEALDQELEQGGNWAIARHGLALGKLATCFDLERTGASPGPRWALELGWRLALGWRRDYSTTMSSKRRSRSPSSQVPLYLWGGSQVPKEKFVGNLHHVTTEAQFKTWRALFDFTIPKDVHVKLAEPSSDSVPRVDSNNPGATIITFRPFYFSLGFTFPMSKFFRDVLCAMECALSQCTPNVYRAVICFENLSHFFKLDLTVKEFLYFFEVRRFEKYAQLRARKPKLLDSLSHGDHVWSKDVLEVNSRWEGEVGDGPLVPFTYCDNDVIRKKLVLNPNMTKVRQALSIPAKFREWRWLLSEHRKKVGGLPPAEDIERWKLHCLKLSDLPVEQEESSTESPEDRKACSGPACDEAAVSRSIDTSPQRRQPRSSLTQTSFSHGRPRLPGSNALSARTAGRPMACMRFGICCLSLQPYCPKLVICLVRRPLRSKVRGVCVGLGTKLRGLYLCPATMTHLRGHEQSSAELTRCYKLQARELKSRLLKQRVLQLRELLV